MLHYLFVALIALVVSGALSSAMRRRHREEGAQQTRYEDSVVLVETLKLVVAQGGIEEPVARFVYGLWGHLLLGEEGVPCACQNVRLHCDDDRATLGGITHTTGWCDVEEGDDGEDG